MWYEMDRRVGLAYLAQDTGTVCGACGSELGPDAVLWKVPLWARQAEHHLTAPVCTACPQNTFTFEGSIPELLEQSLRNYVTVRCAACGREVHRLRDNRPPRLWEVCSRRCRALVVTAKRKARRHATSLRRMSLTTQALARGAGIRTNRRVPRLHSSPPAVSAEPRAPGATVLPCIAPEGRVSVALAVLLVSPSSELAFEPIRTTPPVRDSTPRTTGIAAE
jgi:hypothetical protein